MTGRLLAVHSPNADHGLGIRRIKESPNEKLLACAMYDTQVTLYNNLSQRLICTLNHDEKIQASEENKRSTIVFEEKLAKE
jgi:hypothetical protein